MDQGYLFPRALPEPVEIDDLDARLMLLVGYTIALLGAEHCRSATQIEQDKLASAALQWTAPYLRALTTLASRHEDEFRSLCPQPK